MNAITTLSADVAAAVLVAPIAAVLLPATRRAAAVATSAAVGWLGASAAFLAAIGYSLSTILVTHMVFATAVLASAGIGAASRTLFDDALDAVAVALALSVIAAFGVFAIGRLAGELPVPILNAILMANPIVATTAAAKIDLFRTELLYRLSPVPHQLFTYPAWQASSGLFAGIAGVTLASAWARARSATRTVQA